MFMDFADAIALVKKFPAGHPKIFKGFYEGGFVILKQRATW